MFSETFQKGLDIIYSSMFSETFHLVSEIDSYIMSYIVKNFSSSVKKKKFFRMIGYNMFYVPRKFSFSVRAKRIGYNII